MRREPLFLGLIGLLVGASARGDGRDDPDRQLRERLRALQERIEKTAPGTGHRYELVPVADLVGPRGPFRSARELGNWIVSSVEPRSWIDAGTIEARDRVLLVHQSVAVLARVHAALDHLREKRNRTVCVEVRVSRGKGRFEGRVLGLTGQRVTLVHGARRAFYGDPEVEIGKDFAQVTDPIIEVLRTGASLNVRATLGDDPARVRVELDLRHRRAPDPLRKQETGANGDLELPEIARRDCRTDLIVEAGVWVRVSAAVEVRATPIPTARAR